MLYESLLLNCGGGIINESKKSPQYRGAAALAVGIGGTGCSALAELKKKVYNQLEPDNPGDVIPQYKHIQFLAIDADNTDIKKHGGKAGLDENTEFQPIGEPHMKKILGAKNEIKSDKKLAWMDIDNITNLFSPQGAGGIRQVGRWLLIRHAAELKSKIETKCAQALEGISSPALDIYVFAGISGGTGSGCFLDTCYIIRKAVEDQGWSGFTNIFGFFFLPDVATSIPEVHADYTKVDYNNSNGYAAMRELDHLMELEKAHEWFEQNYGNFEIKTQKPPVDLCHLVSATRASGALVPNGYSYATNVAADCVMAYLADVDLGEYAEKGNVGGLTMRGHLANVVAGINGLPRRYGANLNYHVLGATNAEIPMTQISTYLAVGFYNKFQDRVGRSKVAISRADVDKLMSELNLTADLLYNEVIAQTPTLSLPDIDRGTLAAMGPQPRGKAPDAWAIPGNDWLTQCEGKRTQNRTALNGKMKEWSYKLASNDTLLGRIFLKLYDFCVDPNYGPYYAAAVLNHSGDDILSAIDGAIKVAEGQMRDQELQLYGNGNGGFADYMMQCSAQFIHRPTKKNYAAYLDSVKRWYIVNNQVAECSDVAMTLRQLKNDLVNLYSSFFAPLVDMLDNLKETFSANDQFFHSTMVKADTEYTWRIMELEDVQPHLDAVLEELNTQSAVSDLVKYLLEGYNKWRTGDEREISHYISDFMEEWFKNETQRSLEAYLYDKYPKAKGKPAVLADIVEKEIINKLHDAALPMFWTDTGVFDIMTTFQESSLSVPRSATSICAAAEKFKTSHAGYAIRKTGLKDRIFALRFFSGIPLYAYQGTTLLKETYDKAEGKASGAGSHLYTCTGRFECSDPNKDWRHYLSDLDPSSRHTASLSNREKAAWALYDEAIDSKHGVITNEGSDYFVIQTPDIDIPDYCADNFLKDGVLQIGILDTARQELEMKLKKLHSLESHPTKLNLQNDGDVKISNPEEVRKDYFTRYPYLQKIARQELDKRKKIAHQIDVLNALQEDFQAYENDLENFCDLLFFGILPCRNGMAEIDYKNIHKIYYEYIDARGQAQKQIFCENSKDLMYAKQYPLYQAFLIYTNLNPEAEPRREMDEKITARRVADIKHGDNQIGYQLEQIWNSNALADLDNDTKANLSNAERIKVMRFYYGLKRYISEFKDKFSHQEWTYQQQPAGAQQAAPEAPKIWTLWDGTKNIYVYESNMNMNMAWDGQQWIPVTESMYVWNVATGAWQPVSKDAQGQFVMP